MPSAQRLTHAKDWMDGSTRLDSLPYGCSAHRHVQHTGMFSMQAYSVHRHVQHTGMFSTQAHSADRHVQYSGIFSTLACSAQGHVQYTGMFSTQVCSGAETAILDTDCRRTQTSVSLKSLRPPEVKWTCTGPASDGQTLVRGGCLYSL